ncbi:hypothetical protein GQX73_g7520 [Xylaria multiplex]|uniref:Uncharacterized protein n=1 Tax=Xylaria multiplex TaxID=323545 RepID=A0A7C8IKM7_9PEZI|nr:hypothetical protein GQX73_g7520 [Xylaria multiplex]
MYPLARIDEYRIPTREEVYVLDIIPLTSGPATISSDQKLSLFNPLSLKAGPTLNLVTNHGNITCARAFDADSSVVCTAGENGTVSIWDLRQDARQAGVAQFTTGSTDGLVNICDTRITDEDEVIIQTFNHDSSIHHAAFLNDTEVYAISHDEKLALYDIAEGYEKGAATTDFGDMRGVLGCQYIANIFAKANGAGAVIGAGAHEQQAFELIHLTKGETWALDRGNSVGLPGAHSEEIVRSFCFYDEAQMVFSAGEDGFIKAWRPNA